MTVLLTISNKAMTSVPITQKQNAKISNFSVASLLGDTISKSSSTSSCAQHTFGQRIPSPTSSNDEKSIYYPKNEIDRSHTPQSSIASDEYDSHQEDSIVDIEDINNENTEMTILKKTQKYPCSSGGGSIPIRPTPFSAIAAAAVTWSGVGGGLQWSASRQLSSLNTAVGLFSTHTLNGGQITTGMFKKYFKMT